MSNKNSNNEEDVILSNDAPNDKSTINDVKKDYSATNSQVEPINSDNTSEYQDGISSLNAPAESKKPDISTTEKDSKPESATSADTIDLGTPNQQQWVNPVKSILSQIWHFVDGLIKVFTFCIVAYTLLITKKQVGIMQDQIKEMQTDRNESYKAVITANPVQEIFYLTCIPELDSVSGKTMFRHYLTGFARQGNREGYPLTGISDSEKQTFTKIMFANIGPGMATRVNLSWDNENIDRLYQTLLKYDNNIAKYLWKEGDVFKFNPSTFEDSLLKQEDSTFKTSYESVYYSYMLSNRGETYVVELPIIYSVLFYEFFYQGLNKDGLDDPSVNLLVEFSDTQGIEYSETITLTASNPSSSIRSSSAPGYFSYTITVKHSDPIRKQ